MLISKYKIEIKDEPEFAAESFEEKKARILQGRQGLTLTFVLTFYGSTLSCCNAYHNIIGLCTCPWSSRDVDYYLISSYAGCVKIEVIYMFIEPKLLIRNLHHIK